MDAGCDTSNGARLGATAAAMPGLGGTESGSPLAFPVALTVPMSRAGCAKLGGAMATWNAGVATAMESAARKTMRVDARTVSITILNGLY